MLTRRMSSSRRARLVAATRRDFKCDCDNAARRSRFGHVDSRRRRRHREGRFTYLMQIRHLRVNSDKFRSRSMIYSSGVVMR